MSRDSSDGGNPQSNFLLIRPAAAIVSLGMILPEYLLALVFSSFLAAMVLAIVQTVYHRDEPQETDATVVVP